jgi:hypothetical protein
MYEKQFPGTIQVIFTCLLNQKPVAKKDRMNYNGGRQTIMSLFFAACTSLKTVIVDNLPRQKTSTRLDSSLVMASNS